MKKAYLLLIISTLGIGCARATKSADAGVVEIPESIVCNGDSLLYYARLAYLEDDAKGLFVTAAASYLRGQGVLPDTVTTVGREEAEVMLWRSAQLGYPEAVRLIRCLAAHGCWQHSIPDGK